MVIKVGTRETQVWPIETSKPKASWGFSEA